MSLIYSQYHIYPVYVFSNIFPAACRGSHRSSAHVSITFLIPIWKSNQPASIISSLCMSSSPTIPPALLAQASQNSRKTSPIFMQAGENMQISFRPAAWPVEVTTRPEKWRQLSLKLAKTKQLASRTSETARSLAAATEMWRGDGGPWLLSGGGSGVASGIQCAADEIPAPMCQLHSFSAPAAYMLTAVV